MDKIPFGSYSSFQDCVDKNRDKEDPEAYCAEVKRRIEGKSMNKDAKPDFNYNFNFDIVKEANKEASSKRIIKGIASVEEIDRDNEVVKMSAIKSSVSEWMQNPVIRWKHSDPIGRAIDSEVKNGKFYITAMISDKNTIANEAWGLIQDGIVKSFSIAGKVLNTEDVYYEDLDKDITHITKMELYEVSITDLPANRKSFFEVVSKSLNTHKKKKLGSMKQADKNSVRDEDKNKDVRKMQKEKNKEPEVKDKEPEEEQEEESQEESKSLPDFDKLFKKKVSEIEKQYGVKIQEMEEKIKELESQPMRKAEKTEQGNMQKITKSEGGIAKCGNTIEEVFPFAKDLTQVDQSKEYYSASVGSKRVKDSRDNFTFKEAYMEKYTYTQTGGAGTAGYAMIPVYVDPEIIDRTRINHPTLELMSRRAVKGLTFDYNAKTAHSSAVFLAEDASLSDLTDTYNRYSVSMKYLYSTGRVTGPALVASKGYIDLLANEVKERTKGIKREESATLFNGDNTTYPNEFDGFDNLISTNATALGGALTISSMRTEITQCNDAGGVIDLIVCTHSVHDDLKGLLQDYQRYTNTTNLAWGIETMTFDGIPVVPDRNATSGYMYFLDTSVIFMAVLQDATYEELAKTNDSVKFTIKEYLALVIQAEAFCSMLTGIS